MASPGRGGGMDMFIAKELDGPSDTFYSLWTITEEGLRNPGLVHDLLMLASEKLRKIGGRCRLYVTMGGPADLIGVAKAEKGAQLDEQKMLALQNAIQASGLLTTVFFKAHEFTADGHAAYTTSIKSMSRRP